MKTKSNPKAFGQQNLHEYDMCELKSFSRLKKSAYRENRKNYKERRNT